MMACGKCGSEDGWMRVPVMVDGKEKGMVKEKCGECLERAISDDGTRRAREAFEAHILEVFGEKVEWLSDGEPYELREYHQGWQAATAVERERVEALPCYRAMIPGSIASCTESGRADNDLCPRCAALRTNEGDAT